MNSFSMRRLLAGRIGIAASFKFSKSKSTTTTASIPEELRSEAFRPDFVPFARAQTGQFVQDAPKLENQYIGDVTLRRYLRRILPKEVLATIEPDLMRFGKRVTTDIYRHGLDCERHPPKLLHFDAWGNRVDKIWTTEGWRAMKGISAEEGVVSIAYERKFGEWSRLYQMVKTYLFTISSSLYSCPLSMTDGAAKTIEALNLKNIECVGAAYKHLISRNPEEFWTSGQWMTEKRGGSDVANGTETIAVPQSNGTYRLYGYKWFSSATDSDVTFTLGRIVDSDGHFVKGTKGVTMFYLKLRDEDGKLNNIQVMKLKDKLGTKQVPTAELLLDGAVAHKVSEDGKGIKSIANMLTVTRIHNSLASSAGMRRILSMSRDYSQRRVTFGKPICHYPLHMQTLAAMELEARGATLLTLETSRLLGLDDCHVISSSEANLLRLLTPIAKLYTAKQAMAVVSEGVESFGGQGYMEDTGIPRLFRDAQVTPIWEGTTNILALDVLRAIAKTKGEVLLAFQEDIVRRLAVANSLPYLEGPIRRVTAAVRDIGQFVQEHQDKLQVAARDLSFSLARTYIATLLIEHAAWNEASDADVAMAQRWAQKDLAPVKRHQLIGLYSTENIRLDYYAVMDGYDPSEVESI